MEENIKLVICDIDWTILWRSQRLLPNYTKKVIEKLHEKGISFGLASGRPIDEVKRVYESWNLSFPCDLIISMNGGEIWDEHHQKFKEFYKLKKEWIKEIVKITSPLDVNPYMYYHGGIKALKYSQDVEETSARANKPMMIAKDLDDFAGEETGKIMIRVKEEQMPQLENYVKKYPSPYYREFKTQRTLMEFCDRRISKGTTLKKYCEWVGLPISKVVAFGDTTNDNEMLANAGWGVCLLNGSEDTKAVSDDITEHVVEEEGFAHYVVKHILKEEVF